METLNKIIWNRLTAILVAYAFVLVWLVVYGADVYLNAIVLLASSMATILWCVYISESKKQTEGEKWIVGHINNLMMKFN